jgi:hypothetical protein
MDRDELKRKLRNLKKLEIKIRFEGEMHSDKRMKLIWNEFFSTGGAESSRVKYPFDVLGGFDKAKLKAVFDEYFYRVYYQKYKDNGIVPGQIYDPELLTLLGLGTDAGFEQIKKRFRELAKLYHPDHGGDGGKMAELLDTYHKLVDK